MPTTPYQSLARRTTVPIYVCAECIALLCALAGCRTPIYTTRSLPIEYQAPLVSPASSLGLEAACDNRNAATKIGPGDVLTIRIATEDIQKPAAPIAVRVASDGMADLPEIGSLKLGGLESSAAKQRIASAVANQRGNSPPSVEIAITERGTCHVNVAGAVARPGPIELSSGSIDLASALRAAGGLSDSASTKAEIVHRHDTLDLAGVQEAHVDQSSDSKIKLASLTESAKPAPSEPSKKTLDLRQLEADSPNPVALEDGDTVTVLPQDKRTFRMEGLSKKPADIELKVAKDTHVLEAVEMAGAKASQLADLVFVIRQLPKMDEPIIISISLARAKHDEDENLRLAEGDIVVVRRTMTNMVGSMFHGAHSQ